MKKSDITYFVGCVFAAGTSFFYLCEVLLGIRVPRYYPTLHEWRWANDQSIPSQAWYGMQAFAYLAAGIIALVVYILCKRASSKQTEIKVGTLKAMGIGTFVIISLCLAAMMYHEFAKWHVF